MRSTLTLLALLAIAFLAPAEAQQAAKLDAAATEATLATKPPGRIKYRGPASPVRKRTYTRNTRGLEVEIVEMQDGRKEERPYVAIPILFVRAQAELLDTVSKENLKELGEILKRLTTADPKAKFTIQGHTSAEGARDANVSLSHLRADRIYRTLVTAGVPEGSLSRVGFGPDWATAEATALEAELQKDRRVLVVRD